MRRLVTALNITIDGFVDHDAVVADDARRFNVRIRGKSPVR